ncbi:peptidase MA family metallohydrolase [Thermogemmatispora onikobensis]|uniref:peptidase MA family metallohydrolase n=1 Tax=Thermogemmatispora onikobensis TaxID=732234 RepID=UPI000852F5F3|nr:peptidase MA family metallohydrolase [Thermogemmatispora onikobensis]
MLVLYARLPLLVRVLSSLAVAWLLITGGLAPPALAERAADPISVMAQSQNVHFPDYIDFQMSASDSLAPIVSAYIHVSIPLLDVDNTNRVAVNAAKTITLHWRMNTSGDNYVMPGATITYYWELSDSLGNVHSNKYTSFIVTDTRFSWKSATQGYMHLHWYSETPGFGQALLTRATTDEQHLVEVTGLNYHQTFDLWVYSSENAFRSALPPDTLEWVGGEAFPPLNEAFFMVSSLTDETLARDMPHEMTHLLLHQTVSAHTDVPLWFDEGLAVYCQLYHEPEMTDRLNEALRSHSLLPLSRLMERFPSDSDSAYLAYAESWNLVDYMYRTFGKPTLQHLFQLLGSGKQTFDESLQAAIGEDQAHLENQWHLALHQPPTLSPAEMQTPVAQPVTTARSQLPVPATSDNRDIALAGLGALLMLTALLGTALLLVSVRNQRLQALAAVEAAEQILAVSRRDWQGPPPFGVPPSPGPQGGWPGPSAPGTASGFSYFDRDRPFGLPGKEEGPLSPPSQEPESEGQGPWSPGSEH